MVALLLYACARGNRSSRGIERACWEDVAYKVITGMRTPDHSTIAEFRRRHESEIKELFDDVLGLCQEAGLVSVGVIAIDGTKIEANASMDHNRTYQGIVDEILGEAEETDRREDALYGEECRGDELPEQLRTPEGRKAALEEAKRRLAERKRRAGQGEEGRDPGAAATEMEMAPEGFVTHHGGRGNWFREARRELERRREQEGRPIGREREERLLDAARRLEEEHQVLVNTNVQYERYRERGVDKTGRRFGSPPKPYQPPELPEGKINLSDPDSRVMRTQGTPPRQAYNAQTAVNEHQIILAAEVTVDAADFGHLQPMFETTLQHLARHGVEDRPEAVVADAGYWHTTQMQNITGRGVDVLIPPDGTMREGNRPGWENGLYAQMRERLSTEDGKELYRRRKITIEPIYGQIKYNRRIDRFMRRGRAAAQSEFRLVAATSTHNLLKLHSHWITSTA